MTTTETVAVFLSVKYGCSRYHTLNLAWNSYLTYEDILQVVNETGWWSVPQNRKSLANTKSCFESVYARESNVLMVPYWEMWMGTICSSSLYRMLHPSISANLKGIKNQKSRFLTSANWFGDFLFFICLYRGYFVILFVSWFSITFSALFFRRFRSLRTQIVISKWNGRKKTSYFLWVMKIPIPAAYVLIRFWFRSHDFCSLY